MNIEEGISSSDPIVIVGAGPAGLILAYLLASEKVPVRVFERHKDFDREFRGEFLQPSGMKILEELNLAKNLKDSGKVLMVDAVRMHFKDKVFSTSENDPGEPAGFLVHQPSLLESLSDRCCTMKNFQLDMNSSVTAFLLNNGKVEGVTVRHGNHEERVKARFVVVSNGRMSTLRSQLGLTAKNMEPPYSIMWHRFDMSHHRELMPTSLDGFVGNRGLCVVFPIHNDRLQVMWRRRAEHAVDWHSDSDILGQMLLDDLPAHWRGVVEQVLNRRVERQMLKVVSDQLNSWWSPGALFIGDAAHSMSPIGGQGLAMAIRDAVVTANHIIRNHRGGDSLGEQMCSAIQLERTPEIEKVQQFQARAAQLHVAKPMAQWMMARIVIPLATQARGRSYMYALENGFTDVRLEL